MHFACLVRFGHPLAVAEAPIQERDVLQYPFVLPYSVEPGHTEVAKRCIANGLPPTMPHYAADDITLIMRIVRNSNAVFPMLTPRPDFGGSAEHGVLLRDALHYPPRSIVIAYARGQPRSTAAERFEQLLRAQLARLQ